MNPPSINFSSLGDDSAVAAGSTGRCEFSTTWDAEFDGTPLKSCKLTLGVDDDVLVASLSDSESLLLVGELTGLSARLERLERQWTAGIHPQISSDEDREAKQLRSLGTDLFETLIPTRIKNFFSHAPRCKLHIHHDATLAHVPWETVFDGKQHWMDGHQVVRTVLGLPETTQSRKQQGRADGQIQLLLVTAGSTDVNLNAYAQSLFKSFEQLLDVDVKTCTLEQLGQAIDPPGNPLYDVIHFVGRADQVFHALETEAQLGQMANSSKLLVIDECGAEPSTMPKRTTWSLLGPKLKALYPYSSAFGVVRHPAFVSPDAGEVTCFYDALMKGARIGAWSRSRSMPYRSPKAWIAIFGDADFTLCSRVEVAGFQRSFRQVTSLSYDLVESTKLMQRLGIEAYSVALNDCHTRFARIVRQWEGVSDKPQGDDGIMCYFGVHHAREDSVRFAISAAMDLMDEARRLDIKIRIGMATGQVAVDDVHFVGLTVHLAARIQSLASAGEILVSETTADLAKSHFGFELFRQAQTFKGFSDPTTVFKVEQAKTSERWSQWANDQETQLIGRDAEIGQLHQMWAQVAKGISLWLHLTGEPGIGKSRLIASFANNFQTDPLRQVIDCRCFPETRSRAFGPIIDLLERWFRIQPGDSLSERQEKTEAVLLANASTLFDRKTVAYLLGLPFTVQQDRGSELTELSRKSVLHGMAQWLASQVASRPLLFIVEDIQWVDPSTLEFLNQLKIHAITVPLMVVITERSDQTPTDKFALADTALHLGHLSASAVREMIFAIAPGQGLSRRQAQVIEMKSDGVPLFIEMSTRMVLESGHDEDVGNGQITGQLPIPAKVSDLLMQRLDNLGVARPLAQLCGVIGREFSLALLQAVAESEESPVQPLRLHWHLATLIQSGLLVQSRNRQRQHFNFRHALIQDVAYQSMWETDRKVLHKCVAQTIEGRFPEISKSNPEILALHHSASGDTAQALKWHLLAAKKHKYSGAHLEALLHLNAAKSLLESLATSTANTRLALEIELTTAGQLIATKGYGAQSVGQCYLRALPLSHSLNDKKSLLRILLGIEAYYFLRGDFGQAHAYIAQAQHVAQEFNDGLTTAQCLWAVANILFQQGEMQTALSKMNECVRVCRSSGLGAKLVQSPEVMSLMYASFCLWELGYSDQALRQADVAVDCAEAMAHKLGIGQSLGVKAMVQLVCGLNAEALLTSERAVNMCNAAENDMWEAHGRIIHGSVVSELGDPERGLAIMDAAYEKWVSTGAVLTCSFYLTLRAQANAKLQKISKALELIEQALGIVADLGERYYEAEILRLKGELVLRETTPSTPTQMDLAQALFKESMDVAQARQLKSLALRTATSIANLAVQKGHLSQGASSLTVAMADITEGYSLPDFIAAQSLHLHFEKLQS